MGRNSKPRSFQSLSSFAVPGMPRGGRSVATKREEVDGVDDADDDDDFLALVILLVLLLKAISLMPFNLSVVTGLRSCDKNAFVWAANDNSMRDDENFIL